MATGIAHRIKAARLCVWRSVVGVCALGVAATAMGQDAAANLRFVPPEAMAVVVAHPRAAAMLPDMALMPKEVITAAGLKELGFDPLDIETLVAFVEPPMNGPPGFGAVLRFSKPYNRDQALPQLVANTQPGTLGGRPFLKSRQPQLPSIMMPNDRTLVLAPEATLAKMIKPQQGKNPAVERLQKLEGQQQLAAVVLLDPIRPLLNAQLAQAPLPPPFEPFRNIPNQVSAIDITIDMAAPGRLSLVLQSPDAGSAEQLQQTLSQGLQMAKQMFLAQGPQQGSEDPVEQAAAKYAERLANHFLELLSPEQQGDRVTLDLENQGGMATTGVLVGLLLPAVQSAREAARRTQASNNLKQIAIAMHNYHDTHGQLPPAAARDANDQPLLSWRVHILPYIGEEALYRQFHLDEPWDSEHNKTLIEKMPQVYASPNLPGGDGRTVYLGSSGEGALLDASATVRFRDVTDGLSNTIMVVEAGPQSAVIWTQPADWEMNPEDPLRGLLGLRPNGFQAALADGSVRFIAQTIDPSVLRALVTRSGGERVDF